MKNFRDKKIIILSLVLIVFTISYFVVVNKISYSFVLEYDVHDSYNMIIDTIKKSAVAYGKNNLDLFKKDKIVYIKVQDLIDNNYIYAKHEGNILNPLNNESMNSNVIKLKLENDEIIVEIDS